MIPLVFMSETVKRRNMLFSVEFYWFLRRKKWKKFTLLDQKTFSVSVRCTWNWNQFKWFFECDLIHGSDTFAQVLLLEEIISLYFLYDHWFITLWALLFQSGWGCTGQEDNTHTSPCNFPSRLFQQILQNWDFVNFVHPSAANYILVHLWVRLHVYIYIYTFI